MPVKVLVIGVGSIGERHLRCFQYLGADVALCEPMQTRREDVAQRYQVRHAYDSVEAAAREQWDAAVICTPANFHIDHGVLLAPACKAILIEKPLATSAAGIERLQAATRGLTVGMAYVLRAHPAVQAARDVINSGTLGPLLQLVINTGQHFPTYRPAYREIYYTRRETGGGAIQDALTHHIDMSSYLAGPYDWVFCDASHQALPGVEVEDTVHFSGRTAGGKVMAAITLCQFMAPNETHINLHCQNGSITIRFHEQRWGLMRLGETEWQWTTIENIRERDDIFRLQAQAFLDAVAGKRPVLCTLEEGLHDLRVGLAALESNGERRIEIAR